MHFKTVPLNQTQFTAYIAGHISAKYYLLAIL